MWNLLLVNRGILDLSHTGNCGPQLLLREPLTTLYSVKIFPSISIRAPDDRLDNEWTRPAGIPLTSRFVIALTKSGLG